MSRALRRPSGIGGERFAIQYRFSTSDPVQQFGFSTWIQYRNIVDDSVPVQYDSGVGRSKEASSMNIEEAQAVLDGLIGWNDARIEENEFGDCTVVAVDPLSGRTMYYDNLTGFFR